MRIRSCERACETDSHPEVILLSFRGKTPTTKQFVDLDFFRLFFSFKFLSFSFLVSPSPGKK